MFNINNKIENENNIFKPKMEKIIFELILKSQKELPFSLQVNDLCELLPHSNTKIYLMLESGELPARKIGGKWVISRDQFLAWYYGVNEDVDKVVI